MKLHREVQRSLALVVRRRRPLQVRFLRPSLLNQVRRLKVSGLTLRLIRFRFPEIRHVLN
jgi:hypothetical protein